MISVENHRKQHNTGKGLLLSHSGRRVYNDGLDKVCLRLEGNPFCPWSLTNDFSLFSSCICILLSAFYLAFLLFSSSRALLSRHWTLTRENTPLCLNAVSGIKKQEIRDWSKEAFFTASFCVYFYRFFMVPFEFVHLLIFLIEILIYTQGEYWKVDNCLSGL